MLKLLVVAVLVALFISVPVSANVITYAETYYSTNYVAFGLGMRDVGAGTLTVTGVSGTVTKAILFWHGPTNSSDPLVNATVTFNGTSITGANIGISSTNGWGTLNSMAYRADVTSLVSGNGAYTLANFQKSNALINGCVLFVFFNGGASKRDVVMFEGNDSNQSSTYDTAGWDFTLSGINYKSGTANLTLYVSDGQNFNSIDDGSVNVNGTAVATGGIFQGAAPYAPGAGVNNGSLTDVVTYDVTSFLTVGTNSLHITTTASTAGTSDALSAVVAAVDLPAGAAPGAPAGVPAMTPAALGVTAILLALLAFFMVRRPRHQN